ncbi:MAG: hypothetical protein ABI891_13460 [Acidobacteriota bacterium]
MKKRCIFKILILFTFIFSFQFSVRAQESELPKDSRFYERAALRSYQKKDFQAFLENMKRAESLRPNHPRLLYNLADAYALNGEKGAALFNLNKLAEMKLFYEPEKDDDFSSIKNSEDFQNIVRKFYANAMPTGNGKTAFTVSEKGLVTESIAFDKKTQTFYLASVAQRKILKIDSRGESKIFANQSAGLWSVFGMKVDAKCRLLWAATSAHKQMPNLKEGEDGQAGIFAFDLKTGNTVKKYLLTNDSRPHLLGDLKIAPNGNVFATDSLAPVIYVIRKGKNEIETFLESEDFASLQGLDFSSDGKILFVADYAKGIFKINLDTKEKVNLTPPESSTLLGIDGIYFAGKNLIAVQNGVNPQRIVRLNLSKDSNKIERLEVLEANNPVFDDITLGVLDGNQFYFVANSQWNLLGDDGKFAAPDKLQDVSVIKISVF